MNMQQERFDELDQLIGAALKEEPGQRIPDNFTGYFIRRVKRRLMWQELLTDFSAKMAVVLFALALFAGIYFLVIPDHAGTLLWQIVRSWQAVAAIGVVLLFTFLTDQVFLKFIIRKSR
jgi:hypothetical protein